MRGQIFLEEIDGVCITADFQGKRIEDYAMAWLKLSNIARVFHNVLLKVKNDETNKVYVYCSKNKEKDVCDFLNEIILVYDENGGYSVGKVIAIEDTKIVIPTYEYPSNASDEEIEAEFTGVVTW